VAAHAQQARWIADEATFQHRDVSKEIDNKTTGTFTVTAVGDLLIQEPIGAMIDPRIQDLLKSSDTTVANMEATVVDRRLWTEGLRGNWTPKETAADIAKMGVDMVTGANNHTWDMGENGIKSSMKWLDDAGIPVAGVGKNLESARMPVFQYTPKGRIAMIGAYAVALSGQGGGGAAGSSQGNSGGGWGFDPLRLTTWNVVTREQLASLKSIRDSIVARRTESDVVRPIQVPKDEPDRVQIFADNYMVGPKPGEYRYVPNRADVLGNVTAVRNAKEYSDYVVFSMHIHQNRYAFQAYSQDNYPNQYVIDFAHRLVDNGADMFLGTGNHTMQGVEIYKGRPIFYNLGNFAIHEILLESPDAKPGETAVESDEVGTDYFQQPENLTALLATTKYVAGKLVEVRLHPVDLGARKIRPWSQMSIDRTPSTSLSQEILQKVQAYSAPFGTKISIEGGVGVIRVAPDATKPLSPDVAAK
jgi:poly-gamma-glutamate synthesis protein (capsule biosynthesis protein)